jgi:hypothetical protein
MFRQTISVIGATLAIGTVVVIGSSVAWSKIAGPVGGQAYLSKAEFDQAFIDAGSVVRPQNTAAYREKLREAGWKLLNASTTKTASLGK